MSDQEPFGGFRMPNYTQIPNQVFDEMMAELTSSELRVLLYIMRRTFGFRRNSDAISINQFVDGITKSNGEVLDRGCGVSRSAAITALKSLEQRGYIVSHKRSNAKTGSQPTVYSLKMADDSAVSRNSTPPVQPLDPHGSADTPAGVQPLDPGSSESTQPPVHPLDPQKIDLQNKGEKESRSTVNEMDRRPIWQRLDPVQDREQILATRFPRPEVPSPTEAPAQVVMTWHQLQREWDQLWNKDRRLG